MLSSKRVGLGERIVLVHGFTQTAETWDGIAQHLKSEFELLAIDAPNHGDSSDISLNLESGARSIIEVGGEATYVGYSMGGRFCLTAAFAEPQNVKRLVLVSTTAGIEDKDLRNERLKNDEELARRVEQIGVAQFIDEWLTNSLFSGLTEETNQRAVRLKNTAIGLSSSLRLCGAGRQQPTWTKLSELKMPVLVMAGENDSKYVELAERMVQAIGENARLRIVKNSGHTPHLEQESVFVESIRSFVKQTS